VPGAKHRVRGEGAAAPRPGGKPGDLIIEVSIGTHPYLKRGRPSGTASDHPLDLSMDLPLSIAEAVEGAAIDVPVLDRTLKVKIPPGTGSHAALRLTGGGLALASGARGDLYVVTRIVVPCSADLPEAERDAIRSAGFAARPVRAWEENTD
jgi:DnaJ-class molecular chaperone